MPGRGRHGLGKGGALRHRKILRDSIQGITKPAIRRLARRGGVKRISGLVYEETRGVLKVFLENVIRDAVIYTEHAKRNTVTALDVVYALKRQGRTLYGYDNMVRRHSSARRELKPMPKLKVKLTASPLGRDHKRDPEDCLKYYKQGDEERRRLTENEYLNDIIINTMMCKLTAGHGFFPMTTFFYDERAKGKPTHRYFKPTGKESRFVPQWAESIADMDGVVIPINEHGNHWTVIIVDFRDKTITYFNSLFTDAAYADSAVELVFEYLKEESKGRDDKPKKKPFDFDRSKWTVEYEDDPAQPDSINCGVYAIMRVRKYIQGIDFPANPKEGRKIILNELGL